MEQKKEYKLYKRRWVVLLSFVCVNAVMQYGWAFFSSIVTDAWHFYGFQDAASGEAAISALTMIIMGCMIVFSIPASWVFEKIGSCPRASTRASSTRCRRRRSSSSSC